MRAIFFVILFLIGLLSSVVFTSERAFAQNAGKVIDDSLVENLKCQELSVDAIYKSIRAEAFHVSRSLPIVNWSFRSGKVDIAGCWGLSSAQRVLFYMARYYEAEEVPTSQMVPVILDMFRAGGVNSVNSSTQYEVFKISDGSLFESSHGQKGGLWQALLNGYSKEVQGQRVLKTFKTEIEDNQRSRFFRFSNIGKILKSGERSENRNRKTLNQLLRNLDGKRLTLLNLRTSRNVQHIVLAKSYVRYPNFYEIRVYDPNEPGSEGIIFVNAADAKFYAPQIMPSPEPVGVFIVDEEGREPLEKALLSYYQQQCQ